MAYPNPLQKNPKITPRARKSGDGYDLEFWASYFPDGGVEYHVNIINITPSIEVRCELQAKLYISHGDRAEKNRARMAQVYISSARITFKNAPKKTSTSCWANCSPEQISRVSHAELMVQGFEEVA